MNVLYLTINSLLVAAADVGFEGNGGSEEGRSAPGDGVKGGGVEVVGVTSSDPAFSVAVGV